jgi:hypothetical protein
MTIAERDRILRQRTGEVDGEAAAEEYSILSNAEETATHEDEGATLLEILASIPGIQDVSLEELTHEDAHPPGERSLIYPYLTF